MYKVSFDIYFDCHDDYTFEDDLQALFDECEEEFYYYGDFRYYAEQSISCEQGSKNQILFRINNPDEQFIFTFFTFCSWFMEERGYRVRLQKNGDCEQVIVIERTNLLFTALRLFFSNIWSHK